MSTILLGVAFFCVLAADGYKALPGLWAVNPQSFSQGEAAAWGVTGSKVNMPTFRSRYHGYLFCFVSNKTKHMGHVCSLLSVRIIIICLVQQIMGA